MERRNNSAYFLILAALAGMFTFVPRATESTTPPIVAAQSPAAAPPAAPISDEALSPALEMVDEFYYGGEASRQGEAAEPSQTPWAVDSIIATVPDPIESALGNQFDNFLDAIQRALADSNYSLDRFRNPWPLPAGGGESSSAAKRATYGGADADSMAKPSYATEPGMMLYRDSEDRRLMVIFLVGETPTRGIHKSALKNALRQALEVARAHPASPRGASGAGNQSAAAVIKLMGPSFSGSADSVRFALSSWLSTVAPDQRPGKIEIVSGSATAIKKKDFLQGLEGVEYHATVIRDKYVLQKLMHWLGAPDGDGVAVLAEEDTSYPNDVTNAAAARGIAARPKMPVASARPNSGSVADTQSAAPAASSDGDRSLKLFFPLHIAELQRAMKRAAENSKPGAMPVPLLHNPNLPLGSEEAQTRVDVFPLYSNSETNSLELLLEGVMRTITDRQIKYVLIIATDTEDTIFLAQKIRESCPNVTPIALNGDVLFLHSDVNTLLRGMIVASSYPLYFENQFWTRPENSKPTALLQFPSDTAEGVYNATMALLGRSDAMLDYAEPFRPGSTRPPVWISMVGSDQFWPLATYGVDSDTADYLVDSPARRPATIPANPTFKVYPTPFLILCALVGVGSVLIWRLCTHTPTENSRGFDYGIYRLRTVLPIYLQQNFGDAPSAAYVHARRVFLLMFLMVLFGLSTTVACFFFLPLRTGAEIRTTVLPFDSQLGGFQPLVFAAAVLISIGAIFLWSDRTLAGKSLRPEFDDTRWRQIVTAAVAILVCGLWLGLAPWDSTDRIFLFFRVIDLDGGVSPLVPLLLAYGACLTMILGAMRRRAFVEARLFDTQFLDFKTDSFAGVEELEARIRDEVKADGWKSWEWRAIVGAVSLAYLVYFRPWESRIDGRLFMLTFFVFSLAAYAGIATALLRLLTVWGATQKLLQRLFWHPSRGGYAQLREEMAARDAAIDLFSPAPTLTALEAGLTNVRSLVKAGGAGALHGDPAVCERLRKFLAPLTDGLVAGETLLNRTLQASARGDWDEEATRRRATELQMSSLSQLVASIFEPLWRTRIADPESKIAAGDSDKPSSIDEVGEIYVATRVVDLLRQVMPQLRTLALTSTFAMLMMLFAISSYPFPTRDHLLWFSWVMVVAAVVSIPWMCFSLNRDRVVSLICGMTPGQIDWNATLVTQLLTHGLIPVLVLLGAAYPAELGRFAQWAGGLFGGHG